MCYKEENTNIFWIKSSELRIIFLLVTSCSNPSGLGKNLVENVTGQALIWFHTFICR